MSSGFATPYLGWRLRLPVGRVAAATLLFLAACPGTTNAVDSGVNPDAGRDSGAVIPCTLIDDTACTRDGGGFGVCCDGVCVQTGGDSANCDGCGRVCPAPSTCQSSTCLSGAVQGNCSDGGCVSGLVCARGFFCESPSCPAGEVGAYCALAGGKEGTCCSGECADRLSDDQNCGQCGQVCADGGYCLAGVCFPNPDCTTAKAGGMCRLTDTRVGSCCDGACGDLGIAAPSCGTCGSGCPLEATCAGGVCLAPDGGRVGCGDAGGDCAAGSSCVGERCLPQACAAEPGALCSLDAGGAALAGACCQSRCADLSSDPFNCGACGHTCDSGLCDGVCLSAAADGGPDGGDGG